MPSPDHARQLKVVIYHPTNKVQHWGLLLDDGDDAGFGTLYDIGGKSSGWALVDFFFPAPTPTLQLRRRFNWSQETIEAEGGKVVTFAECWSTDRRVQYACLEVLEKFRFDILTQNCQTFVIEVLKQLSAWDPKIVGSEVLAWVRREASFTTRARRVPRAERPRFTEMSEADDAREAWEEGWEQFMYENVAEREARRIGARSDPVRYAHPVQGYDPRTAVMPRDDGARGGGRRTRTGTRETSTGDAQPVRLAERTMRTRSEPGRGAKLARLLTRMAA